MKKNLFMVAAVALMAMVSCNKEEINGLQDGQVSDIVFSAELEQPGAPAAEQTPAEAQTKTSLGTTTDGVTSVNWVAGDKVKINGVEFSAAAAGSRTDFTTTASFTEAETYYAVYPATAAGAADHSKVTIPASQKGTFAEAAISVAKSNTQSLHFKNVASILKFRVPAAAKEVTIESNANLAGTFEVTFNEAGEPVIGSVTSGSKKITLTGTFAAGTDYYVAVLPGSHTFTMRIDGYLSKASTKAVATKRAVVSNLQILPAPVQSTWVLAGVCNNWNSNDSAKKFYVDESGFVLKNIAPNGEFKLVNAGSWKSTMVPAAAENKWSLLKEYMANMKRTSGKYDIWISADGKEVCIVEAGKARPSISNSNRQYYIVLQHNWDWANRKLHAWIDNGSDATNVNLMGDWPGKSPDGTFDYDNNGYSYWAIPSSVYGKKLGIIFSNNGADQTQNKYYSNYCNDYRFWLDYTNNVNVANEF